MIGTPLGAPVPQQMGSMTFPQQATQIPMQVGTMTAQQNGTGLDISAIMNMMIMLIVVVMMMKMMTKATGEMA